MHSIPFKYHPKHNSISKAYAILIGKPFLRQFVAKIKFNEYMGKFKFKSLLDLGCDDGEYAFDIEKKYKNVTIDAIDTFKESIDICNYIKKKIHSKVNFECKEIGDVKKKYDLILVMGTLSFNLDDQKLIKDIEKHLDKNGILLIRDAYCENTEPKRMPEDTKFLMIRDGYNKKEILKLIGRTRLRLIKFERYCGGISKKLIIFENMILMKSYAIWGILYIILKPIVYLNLKFFDKKKDGIEIIGIIKKDINQNI